MYHTGPMRTTVTLDRDIYEAALYLTKVSGRRLGKVLSELAQRGLAREAARVSQKKARLPVFDVPPNAPMIPASRVQQMIDEEGYF